MSPDPGGRWDWLIGVLALGIASTTLVLVTRRAVSRDPPEFASSTEDEDARWQERLDDELINAEL